MPQRIIDNLRDRDTIDSRSERLRLSHQIGEYLDEFTTIFGITGSHPKAEKRMHEILDRFLYGDKK